MSKKTDNGRAKPPAEPSQDKPTASKNEPDWKIGDKAIQPGEPSRKVGEITGWHGTNAIVTYTHAHGSHTIAYVPKNRLIRPNTEDRAKHAADLTRYAAEHEAKRLKNAGK